MILHEKTKQEFGYDFMTASNRKQFYCICDYCSKEFIRIKRTIVECNRVISKDSCGVGECKKKKSEEVHVFKYGMINSGGSKASLEKRKATSLEKYGNEEFNRSKECKKRNNEKYGADYHTQSSDFIEKIHKTCQEKYGADHYSQTSEYKEKFKQVFLEKYGVDHYSKTDEFKEKLSKTMIEKYGASSIFQSDYYHGLVESGEVTSNFGKTQSEITDFLNNFGFDFKPNRSLLSGKEIDLYDSNLNLAIEYCGLYWHNEQSPQPRKRSYHFDKYRICLSKGIRLITIFEDEWKLRNEHCKDFLRSVISHPVEKIFARKCQLKQVDGKEALNFCDSYHILGKGKNPKISFGLYFNNELLGLISLNRHHRDNYKDKIILSRMCFKSGYQILGGASKLLSACVNWSKNVYTSIISWSDNRWSMGSIYETMGFVKIKDLPPDYSYVLKKGGSLQRLSKQSCKKCFTNCPDTKTEREWMSELGYARIWDCGKKTWELKL